MINESFDALYRNKHISSHLILQSIQSLTRKIFAVSSISAMNVDTPRSWLSPAPTRQSTESKTGRRASLHGTQLPVCASSAMTPTCRMYVLLPPMFGPAEESMVSGWKRMEDRRRTDDLELADIYD